MTKLIGGFQKLVVTVFDCIIICFKGDKFLKIYIPQENIKFTTMIQLEFTYSVLIQK